MRNKQPHSTRRRSAWGGRWSSRYARLAGTALIVGLLAVVLTRTIGAQTYLVAAEAEDGAVAGSLTTITDTSASGGSAVKFKGGSTNGNCSISTSRPLQDQAENKVSPVWPHTKPNKAVVYFLTGSLPAEWANYVVSGAQAWSESDCIDARTAASCPGTNANCVPIVLDTAASTNGTLGTTHSTYDSNKVMQEADIVLYEKAMSSFTPERRLGTTTHEMGHALGLKHRATRYVLLYNTNEEQRSRVPDNVDFANLLALYGIASASDQAASGDLIYEEIIN